MKRPLVALFVLLSLQSAAFAEPRKWAESFLDRYRAAGDDQLTRLTALKGDLELELYNEAFKVLSEDVKYDDYRINFDLFTGSPSNVRSVVVLDAEAHREEAWATLYTEYDGVRGPAYTQVDLDLKKTGPNDWQIVDVVYTDWSTPTRLKKLLHQLQNPKYSTEPLDLTPDLAKERRLNRKQSFLFSEGGLYPLRFITSTSDGNTPHLELSVHEGAGGVEKIELSETVPSSWRFQNVEALAFGDFNGDGFGPDVLCVASYLTDTGPSAVARVFYRTRYKGIKHSNGDSYKADPKLNKQFDEKGVSTISEALEVLPGDP